MKQKRFTEAQIIAVLRQQEAGAKVADVCRKHGISDATFYNWKAKYCGMEASEAKRLKALEEENARLKKLLAEQMLDAAALRELLPRPYKGSRHRRRIELEFTPCDLKLLHEIGGAGEHHAPAVLVQRKADGCSEMALAAAGRPEQEDVGALGEPTVAGGDRHDLSLGDHGHGIEGEAVERLSGRQVAGVERSGKLLGQFMLAAAIMGQRQQFDGDLAGLSVGKMLDEASKAFVGTSSKASTDDRLRGDPAQR